MGLQAAEIDPHEYTDVWTGRHPGNIFLNGIDVSTLNADRAAELRNQYIGFIFQSFLLLPKLTVYENIELPMLYANVPPEIRRKTVLELAELVGLEHRLQHIPCELSGRAVPAGCHCPFSCESSQIDSGGRTDGKPGFPKQAWILSRLSGGSIKEGNSRPHHP